MSNWIIVVFSFVFYLYRGFVPVINCKSLKQIQKNRGYPVIGLGNSPLAPSIIYSLFSITVPLNYFPSLKALKKKTTLVVVLPPVSCVCEQSNLLCFMSWLSFFHREHGLTLSSTKSNTWLERRKWLLNYKKTKQNKTSQAISSWFPSPCMQWDWQGIVMVCYHCYKTWPRQRVGAWCKWRYIGCR